MRNTYLILILGLVLGSCSKMEDNYSHYLEDTKVYSPKISSLTAEQGLKTATLSWENPEGDIAKSIFIDYQDDTVLVESMVDTYTINGLEIKGYTVSVYTIDAYGNYSVPTSIQIFPNGEGK